MIDVLKAIPHRPPFLFVDRVVEMTRDSIVAERRILAEEPQFEGHYPGHPIMPGVLICEAVIQAGAILAASTMESGETHVPVLAKMNNVRFKRVVKPGDLLILSAKLQEIKDGFHFYQGKAECGGKTVISLEFVVTSKPKGEA